MAAEYVTLSSAERQPQLPQWVWAILIFITVVQLLFISHLELSPDEAYYWTWAKNLQLSYFDHPPLVGWLIAASTAVFGDTEFGVRFFGPIAFFAAAILLAGAARDFGGNRQAMIIAALFPAATLADEVAALIMTPDTPLFLASALLLRVLAKIYRSNNPNFWLAAGVAGGLALLSKYTAPALALGIVLWLSSVPGRQAHFRYWQLWAGGAVALLLFSPVLIWNMEHGWLSFAKQGGRTVAAFSPSLKTFGDFVTSQIVLTTPLLAILAGAAISTQLRKALRGDDRAILLCALGLPLFFYLLVYSIGAKTEANWTIVCFPAIAVMAALVVSEQWRKFNGLARAAFGTGALVSVLAYFYLASPFENSWGRADITQRLSGNKALAQEVDNIASRQEACMILTMDYGQAALLNFYSSAQIPVIQLDESERYIGWRRPNPDRCHDLTMIALTSIREDKQERLLKQYFPKAEPLAALSRFHRGTAVERYDVWRIRSAAGP